MKNGKIHIEKLNDIEKTQNFKVPADYFDELQKNVLNEIDTEANPKGKIIPFKAFYAVAASIALLAVSIFTFWYFSTQSRGVEASYNELLLEVSDNEIIAYLEYSDVSYSEIGNFVYDDSEKQEKEDPTEFFEFEEEEADALLEYYSL